MTYITNNTEKEDLAKLLFNMFQDNYSYFKFSNEPLQTKSCLSHRMSNLPSDKDDIREHCLKGLSYEFVQHIALEMLNDKFITDTKVFNMNDDIIHIPRYIKFGRIMDEIIWDNEDEDYILLTNSKVSSNMVDSPKFFTDKLGIISTSNGTPYTMGKYQDIQTYTNPYLRWDDDIIYVLSSCKLKYNKEILKHFDYKNREMYLEYELDLKIKKYIIHDLDI